VTEALSSGNVIATAKRHSIQAQQIDPPPSKWSALMYGF